MNDSMDFYESVIDGSSEPGRRFVSAKLSVPCSVLNDMEANAKDIDALQRDMLTPQANCDPVGSEPPPGP
jgi:hypothetical protein